MKQFLRVSFLLVILSSLFFSCETIKFNMMKDDELVAGGVEAWNKESPAAAKPYWSNIKDPALKAKYLKYLDDLAALDSAYEEAIALPASPEAPLVAAWKDVVKRVEAFPPELKLDPEYRSGMEPVARKIVRSRVNANKADSAREFIKTARAFIDDKMDFSTEIAEMNFLASYRPQEASADDILKAARENEDFNAKIAGYEEAAAAYAKLETVLADQAKKQPWSDESPLAPIPAKVKKKRVDARNEMERELRDRAYSFKERIGEEFARTPEGDQLGNMDLAQLLKFHEDIRANIQTMQDELVEFAARYPKVIDKDMLKDVEAQKQDLDLRIAKITIDLKTAQDIASRGKTVLPLMIGLFNPVPGTKGNDQKSRPGKFKGTLSNEPAEYWWGMVSIPKGTLNDLVITVNDNRTVRVFPENTKSGTLIESKKMKDLVNRQYKVGNSWPVLNAGAQLPIGHYYFELQKSKNASYSGDVVVYSSFIMRMR